MACEYAISVQTFLMTRYSGIQVSYNHFLVSVDVKHYNFLSTVCFNRFFLQVSHMGACLNFQKVSIFHAPWDQPLLEKLVYLVIDHQC